MERRAVAAIPLLGFEPVKRLSVYQGDEFGRAQLK
jgi:hypothetical protein